MYWGSAGRFSGGTATGGGISGGTTLIGSIGSNDGLAELSVMGGVRSYSIVDVAKHLICGSPEVPGGHIQIER